MQFESRLLVKGVEEGVAGWEFCTQPSEEEAEEGEVG